MGAEQWMRTLPLRLRSVFRRSQVEREMNEELRYHLDAQIELNLAHGMSREAAVRAARRAMGNIEHQRDAIRDTRRVEWVTELARDLRFAVRQFRRTPIITATTVVVLALGIGINSALFTVMTALGARWPGAVPRDSALVWVRPLQSRADVGPRLYLAEVAPSVFDEFVAGMDGVASIAAYATSDVGLQPGVERGGALPISAEFVSPGYFTALRVRPAIGPGLPPAPGTGPEAFVAVLSEPLWRERFGGDSGIVGKTLRLNGVALTIAGVMPAGFAGASGVAAPGTVWAPLAARPAVLGKGGARYALALTMFARLRPGVSLAQASARVAPIGVRLMEQTTHPRAMGTADVVPLRIGSRDPNEERGLRFKAAFWGTITSLVLAIIGLNVGALQVGSAFGRRREIAIRLSLGASRKRIVRQLLTETALASVVGGVLGLLVWSWIVTATGLWVGGDTLVTVGWNVVAFTLVIAIGTALLFGLSPALHATRLGVADVLKQSSASIAASRSRLQRTFVIAQVVLTQPLLVGLAVLLSYVVHEMNAQAAPGVRDHVIRVDAAGLVGQSDTAQAAIRLLQQRFRGYPGVTQVVPVSDGYRADRMSVHPDDHGMAGSDAKVGMRLDIVHPGYFALMGIPFVRGHDFNTNPGLSAQEVVIRSDLARRLWGSTDPIGKRLKSWGDNDSSFSADDPRPTRVVVGVVDAARAGATEDDGDVRVFISPNDTLSRLWESAVPGAAMLVRTRAPGAAMIPVLRRIIDKEFPDLPLWQMSTLAQQDADSRQSMLALTRFTAGAGALIMLLASIGLYGVVAFGVGQRTREIGIRLALGGSPRAVVAMFFRGGLALGAIGLGIGLPFSVAAIRILAHQMEGPPVDIIPVSLSVAAVVIGVASLATWLPARRAARVNPLPVLRAE